jgi:GNAT superfamily N-acetyltransferase
VIHDADVSVGRAERLSIAAYRSAVGDGAVDLDGAVALRVPQAPDSPMLNRIVGLGVNGTATEAQLDAAIETMAGLRFYVTVSPGARPHDLPEWLQARGFEPGWGWMQFERGVDDVRQPDTALELVEIGREQAGDFARVVRVAYGLTQEADEAIGTAVGLEAWTFWVAYSGDEPAGAAGLFVHDGAGYLGYAGTLPEHRGKGAQGALLASRIRRARELGCDAVFTETGELRSDLPSASYRNILRAGFEELYVVPNWLSPR